eukprot:10973006-Karenia_brevis.AAC.1
MVRNPLAGAGSQTLRLRFPVDVLLVRKMVPNPQTDGRSRGRRRGQGIGIYCNGGGSRRECHGYIHGL